MELDYNSFINGLLNNPSTTNDDRERIVTLLLRERDKGYVTEEQVLEMIHKFSGVKPEEEPKDKYYHNPKKMVSFLYQFSVNERLKWFTHAPDANFEFDYERYQKEAKKEFKRISKGINQSTWNNVSNFIFDTGSDKRTKNFDDEEIKITWRDMSEWCFEHKYKHPYDTLIGNYKFERYINDFKNTIEFRNVPKFSDRIEDFFYEKAFINNPDINLDFTPSFYSIGKQVRIYVDIRQLFLALKEMCKWIIENKSKGNKIEISLGEEFDSYVLSIFHINSYMTIDMTKCKGTSGDFSKVRGMLLNVADWTIEADVKEMPMRIICLDDKTQYLQKRVVSENIIENLPSKVGGVKYLIKLYKNIK